MYIYDKAHELAKSLSQSTEYKIYKTSKEKINSNPKAKEMLNDFKKRQFELQAAQMTGQKIDEGKVSQIQSLYQVLILNPEIAEYLNAELTFNKIISDIYKIISDSVEIDLDFMK